MWWKSWYRRAIGKEPYPEYLEVLMKKLEELYGFLSQRTLAQRERKRESYPVPILSIGNITLGGTGKTAVVLALAKRLSQTKKVVVLHNRYGARAANGRFLVASSGFVFLPVEVAGDEAVLLAQELKQATVLSHKDRRLIARYAVRYLKPDLILLDDGFQQRGFCPKMDVVIIDARNPFGNGHLFPYGILREPPTILSRAHAVLITRSDLVAAETLQKLKRQIAAFTQAPQFRAFYRVQGVAPIQEPEKIQPLSALQGKIALLAAIGNPEGFLQTVQAAGVFPSRAFFYPDHHLYTAQDLKRLCRKMERGAFSHVVTTAKDAVKLVKHTIAFPMWILKVVMELEPCFYQYLEKALDEQSF